MMVHTIVKHNEGEQLDTFGDRVRVIATADQTDGKFAAVEITVTPGNGAPPHVNTREALGWYVLEGTLRFTTESGEFDLDAGGWFYSPKGILHTFHNATDRPVRALMFAVPSGMDGFFSEVGRKLGQGETPRPPTDEEIALLMETAPRYGIDIPPPPG
jgi:quercetin dioxygenase-like cupin family protein